MNSLAVEPNIFDNSSLTKLKRLTRDDDPAAIKAAAQQFEALFVGMMLKSMRDATPKDETMNSDQQRMYESLLDQQLAQVMATRGGGTGLAAMIEQQMTQKQPLLPEIAAGLPLTPATRAFPVAPAAGKSFAVKTIQ